MRNIIFTMLIMGSLFFSSCNPDDDTPTNKTETPTNKTETPTVKTETPTDNTVTAPDKYDFKRDGSSTVNFEDQTATIEKVGKFIETFSSKELTYEEIIAKFEDLKSIVASSHDYFSTNETDATTAIKKRFEGWVKSQVDDVFPNWDESAEKGKAGQIARGKKYAHVTAKGFELNQVVMKGLIGALFTDQMLNHYLSPDVLDAGDNKTKNDAATVVDGKKYTMMEHNWDQAYGYIYGASADATDPNPTIGEDDSFLNKYTKKVDDDADFNGVVENIWNAFKLGRAAIVAHDYEVRNEQAEIIRENISKVIAVRAVHYLQAGKTLLNPDKMGPAFHDLSEGYGFVFSLQFTRKPGTDKPYFTKVEVDAFLTQLESGNGFWDVTAETLDEISDKIAKKFGFTTDQA